MGKLENLKSRVIKSSKNEHLLIVLLRKKFIWALFKFRTIKYIREYLYTKSMGTLERTLEKVEIKTEEAKPLLTQKPLYEGLRKIEDKVYAGGTSIKYWM